MPSIDDLAALYGRPISNDCSIRIAAGGDAPDSYRIGYGYHSGNGLWLKDTHVNPQQWRFGYIQGAYGPDIDVRSCSIDGVPGQALAGDTLYAIYAYLKNPGDTYLTLDFSTTQAAPGDPVGLTPVAGYFFKYDGVSGHKFRLVGWAMTDAAGRIWRANSGGFPGQRGVFFSGVASLYHPQMLNYHIKFGTTTASSVWAECNSNLYVGGLVQEDNGLESFLSINGDVQCYAAPGVHRIGVGIGRTFNSSVSPSAPYDENEFDVASDPSNPPKYNFGLTVSCGDHSTGNVFYRFMARTPVPTLAFSNVTMAMYIVQ